MTDEVRYLIVLSEGLIDYEVTKVMLSNNLYKYYTINEEESWNVLLTLEELQCSIKQINDLGTYRVKRILSYFIDSPPRKLNINNRVGEADAYLKVVSGSIWLVFCE